MYVSMHSDTHVCMSQEHVWFNGPNWPQNKSCKKTRRYTCADAPKFSSEIRKPFHYFFLNFLDES